LVYDATETPELEISPHHSIWYNKYKADAYLEFEAVHPPNVTKTFIAFWLRCPTWVTPNWVLDVSVEAAVLLSIPSTEVCKEFGDTWYRFVVSTGPLGQGTHTFRLEVDNESFGTIYLDDITVLAHLN